MAIPLDPKQVASFEELLMSKVAQQEAVRRLIVEKGIFTKEEFLEMVRVVDGEMKGKNGDDNGKAGNSSGQERQISKGLKRKHSFLQETGKEICGIETGDLRLLQKAGH